MSTRVVWESTVGPLVSVQVPVVPGASVVTDGLAVKDGRVSVNMAASQREVAWRSRLDPVASLTLTVPSNDACRSDIGPLWPVRIEGIAPIHHQDDRKNCLPAWHPWPGEPVTIIAQRPQGVIGKTSTIHRSHLSVKPGKRATDSSLSFRLRSSQGGKRNLVLSDGAELFSVKVNGRSQSIRFEGRG